jgi:fatty acid/phospholipid biosynthesis enzyme
VHIAINVFLDVGANADAKPEHLLQYAQLGNIYAKKIRGIQNPKDWHPHLKIQILFHQLLVK